MTTDTRAKTVARRREILEAARSGEVSTVALSRRFSVSVSTIRRDLQSLAAEGRVARTYGGITIPRSTLELDISHKARQHPQEKLEIARAAARHVSAGDVIIIDSGTTAGYLAEVIRDVPHLTVVTGGMNALLALHDAPAVDLIVIGGRLRHVNQGMVGPLSEQALSYVSASRVFLGAEGLDHELGISCPTLEQATLKSRMIESAREVFVLADHSKLGRQPFNFWTKVPDGIRLITDDGADEETLAKLRLRWRVECVGI